VGAINRFIIRRTNMAGLRDLEEAGLPSAGTFTTNPFLTLMVDLTVLLCFSPAVDLLFRIDR